METFIIGVLSNWDLDEVESVEAFRSDRYRSSGNAYLVQCEGLPVCPKEGEAQGPLFQMFTVLPKLVQTRCARRCTHTDTRR